jgi:hypothetical protein
MPRQLETENRSGPRYLASLEIKAEWDEPSGTHVVAEGTTEKRRTGRNVGSPAAAPAGRRQSRATRSAERGG